MATNTDSGPSFYWDNYRDTTVGRYLFGREYAFIRNFLGAATRPHRLLDVSCGSGRITLPLHDENFNVMGVDVEPVALAAFRRQFNTIPLNLGDAMHLPFATGSFDYVIAIQCFEYFPYRSFLSECNRILTDNGLLIFDFLNQHSYKWLLKRCLGRTLELPSANLSCREVFDALAEWNFSIKGVSGYNWVPFSRHSDNIIVDVVAHIEKALRLDRYYNTSPKILVASRKSK